MPHFVIDCSQPIIELKSPEIIIQKVYDTAVSTGLFQPEDIKVRINSYQFHITGNTNKNFIHVFGNIMEGRNNFQKANLSRRIISELKDMFPDVPVISINIRDFEKASYCNITMI